MKKVIITEKERQNIISQKEKAIMESFASTYNKIKRLDEAEEVSEIFGWSEKEKQARIQDITTKFDTAANAWIEGQKAKNPNLNVQLYQGEVAKARQNAINSAVERSKEMGAKDGAFSFVIKGGKLYVQFEQGNKFATGKAGGFSE